MATSYRKTPRLEPADILVLEKSPEPRRRALPHKLPKLDAPTQLYPVESILESLGKLGKFKSKNLLPGQSFTLSPALAMVENRGWLEAFNVVCVAASQPTYQFVEGIGNSDEARHVDIWLSNLVPGRSYIAQVRVQAGQNGTFHIGTGEGDHLTRPGGDQTIPVLLYQVERELSLIRIENRGNAYYWAFVDATITAVEV